MIKLENVGYQSKGKLILKNINLSLEKGKTYLLLGPSGSGKTSLLKIMNNLISVSAGKIIFDKVDFENIQATILRKKIALIMQDSILFGETIKDNFDYINSLNNMKLDENEFIDLLGELSLKKEMFFEKIEKLSGGEKQRIAIIRTIMNSPEFILADEPFSALDKSKIKILIQILINLVEMKNIGLVIVSHYFDEIIQLFDNVIFIFEGEIIFLGSPQKFLKNSDNRIINFLAGNDE